VRALAQLTPAEEVEVAKLIACGRSAIWARQHVVEGRFRGRRPAAVSPDPETAPKP
jgi:hypothetical protein